jgi:hypothetical protein
MNLLHPSARVRSAFSVVCVAAACAAAVWLLAESLAVHRQSELVEAARDIKAQELRDSILRIDEMLTLSAQMAAVTGDPTWEARYRQVAGELGAGVQDARAEARFAPGADGANRAASLVALENEAFRLARDGRLEEARKVLFSAEYETEKARYTRNVEWFTLANDALLRLNALWSDILRHRKNLDMASSMAVATRDTAWEKHYLEHKPALILALAEFVKTASRAEGERQARELELANFRMARIESDLFALVRSGMAEDARALLEGAEYRSLQDSYRGLMDDFAARLTRSAAPRLVHARQQQLIYVLLAALSGAMLGCLALLGRRRRLGVLAGANGNGHAPDKSCDLPPIQVLDRTVARN